MLTKRCELCENSFSCYGDEKTCWCKEMSIDAEKLNIISNFGIDCFGESAPGKEVAKKLGLIPSTIAESIRSHIVRK